MGHMYKSMGDYVQALSFYNTAEKRYFEEKEKDSDLSPKYLAVTYYGKGNLYRCAENYKLSKSFYEKAKDIYEDIVSDLSLIHISLPMKELSPSALLAGLLGEEIRST